MIVMTAEQAVMTGFAADFVAVVVAAVVFLKVQLHHFPPETH